MKNIFFCLLFILNAAYIYAQNLPAPSETLKKEGIELNIYEVDQLVQFLQNPPEHSIYVVNFWATWCGPCVKELPHFEALKSAYPDQNIEVLLVSLDFEHHWSTKLISFLLKKQLKSEVLVLKQESDANEWIEKVDPAWDGAIPITIMLDASRNKRVFFPTEFEEGELKEAFEEFLK